METTLVAYTPNQPPPTPRLLQGIVQGIISLAQIQQHLNLSALSEFFLISILQYHIRSHMHGYLRDSN